MNILFFVDTYFPYGEAFSSRATNFCRLLSQNHNVHVIVTRTKNQEFDDAKTHQFEKFSFHVVSFPAKYNKSSRITNIVMWNNAIEDVLRKKIIEMKIDVVFSSSTSRFFPIVYRTCRQSKVSCIVEQCEWFDKSNFSHGIFSPMYINLSALRKFYYAKADGIVSISTFLYNFYHSKNKNVIRIPTILDVENTAYAEFTDNEKLTLVFSGFLGGSKENLTSIIRVLSSDEALRNNIRLLIYGPTRDQIVNSIGSEQLLLDAGESVIINGFISQTEVPQVLSTADYLFFMRPHRKSSNAGFPTKLGESFSVGTPVITNDTGDISLYVKNGENGFIAYDDGDEGLRALLWKVIGLPKNDYNKLRENARMTAERNFDFRVYIDCFEQLLKHIGQ